MLSRDFAFHGDEGFHVRPATQFAKLVKASGSKVTILFDGEEFDGKSPLSIMSACIEDGRVFSLNVDGPDENVVMALIEDAMVHGQDKYFAAVRHETGGHARVSAGTLSIDTKPAVNMRSEDKEEIKAPGALSGIAVSDGIAVGPAYVYAGEKPSSVYVRASDVGVEEIRLRKAADSLLGDLQRLGEAHRGEGAEIAEAHIGLLSDESFFSRIRDAIRVRECVAEYAVLESLHEFESEYAQLRSERIRQRLSDITDICYGLHSALTGIRRGVRDIPEGSVIVADDLLPSDTLNIIPQKVAAFILEGGGASSHTAILARSMGLPAVVGAKGVLGLVSAGDTIALDGASGQYWVNPDTDALNMLSRKLEEDAAEREALKAFIHSATKTADGVTAELHANIFSAGDMNAAIQGGAEGIGLFRTEFLYMNRDTPPTREEQLEIYKQVLTAADGRPVTFRTLDMGGDKPITCLPSKDEANPFLGKRGIRYSLENDEVFRCQLSSMLMASAFGDVRIMFPMITTYEEAEHALRILREEHSKLIGKGTAAGAYKSGLMIETPSAALLSRHLAGLVDFFSIGSNDLTQYTMAADRGNPDVAPLGSPYSPAALRLIQMTADAAAEAGIEVCICGESASDFSLAPLYLAFGVHALSVAAGRIAPLRRFISALDLRSWAEKRAHVPHLPREEDVRRALCE